MLQFTAPVLASLSGLLAATKTTTKTSSSSTISFLLIAVIFLALYYFVIRPRRQAQMRQQTQARQPEIGDEIVTTSGIIGRVRSFSMDRASIEIAPGTVIEITKSAIQRRLDPPPYDDAPSSYDAPPPPPDAKPDNGEEGPTTTNGAS